MGEVYKARDTRLDRIVAIKVLPEHVASDPDLKQRFEREAKTISSLNHPHICTLHDIGSQDGAWTAKMRPRPEPRGTTMRGMTLAVLSAAVLSGCATKSFVTERVDDRAAEVDARIAALQRASDESETTIQRQAAQLREVDETANNAFALAMSAGAAADVAQTTADDVSARTDAIERASLRLVCEVVIADSHDQFTFADATLPDSARGTLDGFVEQLRQLPTASYLEIEGHTDATGPAPYNASRAGACGKRPTLPSRAAPAPAPQDERHQLRRRPAGGTQRRPRGAGEEPACRGPRTRMTADKVQSRSDELQRLVPSP